MSKFLNFIQINNPIRRANSSLTAKVASSLFFLDAFFLMAEFGYLYGMLHKPVSDQFADIQATLTRNAMDPSERHPLIGVYLETATTLHAVAVTYASLMSLSASLASARKVSWCKNLPRWFFVIAALLYNASCHLFGFIMFLVLAINDKEIDTRLMLIGAVFYPLCCCFTLAECLVGMARGTKLIVSSRNLTMYPSTDVDPKGLLITETTPLTLQETTEENKFTERIITTTEDKRM